MAFKPVHELTVCITGEQEGLVRRVGQPAEARINGVDVEGQLQVGDFYVLLMTCDCPFEESLLIYLFNRSMQICDKIELGWPYTPGFFSELQVSDESLRFCFPGRETTWELRVVERPRLSIWRQRSPLKLSLKHYAGTPLKKFWL